MLTWILILAPVVAIIVIYRVYQKKNAEREAASSKRFDEIFGGTAKSPSPPMPTPTPSPVAVRPEPIKASWIAKEKFLEPQGRLLYYLLKSGLPDHEVFAKVSINSVVSAAQPLRKPVDGVIDFVVCDKQMKPVAAIALATPGGADSIGECIKAAGLRWVCIAPDALPPRGDVRAVVLGNQPFTNSSQSGF